MIRTKTLRPIRIRHLSALVLLGMAVPLLTGCGSEGERGTPRPAVQERAVSPLARGLLRQGAQALRRQDFDAALAYADSAETLSPADAGFLRGQAYTEMLRLDEATEEFQRVIALQPGYHGAWHYLGNVAFRNAEFGSAIARYRKEVDRHPSPASWRGMGRAYLELGKVDSARYAIEQAIAADSTYAEAFYDLSKLYEDAGEPEKALPLAQDALRFGPGNPQYLHQVGSLLVQAGQDAAALPHLRRAIEAWPWHADSRYGLSQALRRLGRQEEAQAHLEEAERLQALQTSITGLQEDVRATPEDPAGHATLGAALHRAGRFEEALHAYEVAAHLDPQNLDVQNNIANLHLVGGDAARAIGLYREILRRDSTLAGTWVNLGIAHASSGDAAAAQQAWQRALTLDPGHPAAKAYLAKLDSAGSPPPSQQPRSP